MHLFPNLLGDCPPLFFNVFSSTMWPIRFLHRIYIGIYIEGCFCSLRLSVRSEGQSIRSIKHRHATGRLILNPPLSSTINALYAARVQERGSERLSCHAGHQEVSRWYTRGESENPLQVKKYTNKLSTLALKHWEDVTGSDDTT